jgi:hypothetical protein
MEIKKQRIRKIGWMWQLTFLRPLYWDEYKHWIKNALPFGWSIISEPEQNADETDYKKLIEYLEMKKELQTYINERKKTNDF